MKAGEQARGVLYTEYILFNLFNQLYYNPNSEKETTLEFKHDA